MKRKRLIASVLSVALLASVSGCNMFDEDNEAVLTVAEDYAEAITKVKVSKIVGFLVNGDDYEDTLEDLTCGGYDQPLPDGYSDMCSAIQSSITYEIDEDSVESSKRNAEASVDITFTMVDYDSTFDSVVEDGGDLEAFIDALEDDDTDRIEITQTINMVLEDDEWKIEDNRLKNINAIYRFYTDALNYEFTAPLVEYINYLEWYYSNDSVYTNVSQIELDIITTEEGEEQEFEFTYEYYYNGELIYTSGEWSDQGHWIEAYYGPAYDSEAPMSGGSLAAGQYRCVIYDLSGAVIADSSCTVETVDAEASTDLIDDVVWYFSDDDVYTDVTTIELDIIPSDGVGQSITWEFTYEYYLDGELVYSSPSCTDSGFWIEAYYSPFYDSDAELNDDGYLVAGEYRCIMYDLSGNVLADSTCTVEAE